MWSRILFHAERTFLPFALLAAKTFLPPFVDILLRNPCTLWCESFFGWNVILLISAPLLITYLHLLNQICLSIINRCRNLCQAKHALYLLLLIHLSLLFTIPPPIRPQTTCVLRGCDPTEALISDAYFVSHVRDNFLLCIHLTTEVTIILRQRLKSSVNVILSTFCGQIVENMVTAGVFILLKPPLSHELYRI